MMIIKPKKRKIKIITSKKKKEGNGGYVQENKEGIGDYARENKGDDDNQAHPEGIEDQ